jgi:alpha-tubulin suppressor-like RCC1 family protein
MGATRGARVLYGRRVTKLFLPCAMALALLRCSEGETVSDTPDAPDAMVFDCGDAGRSRCVVAVDVGARFACAALADRTVWCWGRNDERQLGYESAELCPVALSAGQTRGVACHLYPRQVPGLTDVTAVRTGGAHACALTAAGAVRCWGGNAAGQLGNGATLPGTAPVEVPALAGVTALAAGARHTCALANGRVFCWGANDRGQLGLERAPATCTATGIAVPCARTPEEVPRLTDVVDLVAGDEHTCARTAAGTVSCWGTNALGELGNATSGDAPTPAPQAVMAGARLLRGARAIAAGAHHTCALRDDGAVLCWGSADRGQLGVLPVSRPRSPCGGRCFEAAVAAPGYAGSAPVESEDAGLDASLDAALDASADARADVRTDARADASDARVDGAEAAVVALPPGVAIAVAAGGAQTCVLLDDSTVRCWGSNRSGELGNGLVGEGGPAAAPVIASPGSATTNPLQRVSALASGAASTCALLDDRSLRCWGSSETGALGVGALDEHLGPVAVTW